MSDRRPLVEWPTLALMVATYGFWAVGTTVAYSAVPLAGIVFTALAVAQFSSLQHEVLHGHPFRSQKLSEAMVFPGLTLVIPYIRFRDTHLAHHRDERLTDPYDDPESNYLDPAVWDRLSPGMRAVLRANNTLLGRMVLGPVVSTWAFMRGDWRAIRAGDRGVLWAWLWHIPGVLMVVLWLTSTPGMGLGAYALAAYLGLAILKIRTFLEHRAHEKARGRTVIVEDRGPLALLFLNNNFHVVHHAKPGVPWYRLPALYREGQAEWLRRNDDYRYASYGEVFRRYFLTAKDPVAHPLWPDRMERLTPQEDTPAVGPALAAAFAAEGDTSGAAPTGGGTAPV